MRVGPHWTIAAALMALLVFSNAPGQAAITAANPGKLTLTGSLLQPVQVITGSKNCQVIRSCNFSRRARVRGCLSSFSCRACSFVRAGKVWRLQCRWGGPPN